MYEKPLLINSRLQVVSNSRWHTMRFLMFEELFPFKYEAQNYGQEALDLRSRSSYKMTLKSSIGENVVTNKTLQVDLRSCK
jgi:hypothetical protein